MTLSEGDCCCFAIVVTLTRGHSAALLLILMLHGVALRCNTFYSLPPHFCWLHNLFCRKNDISAHGLVILCTIQAEVRVITYQKYRDGSKSFLLKKITKTTSIPDICSLWCHGSGLVMFCASSQGAGKYRLNQHDGTWKTLTFWCHWSALDSVTTLLKFS